MRRTKWVAVTLVCAGLGAYMLMRPLHGIAADLPDEGPLPTSQPTQQVTPGRTIQEIAAEFQLATRQLASVLPPKIFSDPAARDDAAPKAIPVLYHRMQLIDELAGTRKIPPVRIAGIRQNNQAMLYLLNDQPTVTKVKGMIASSDLTRQIEGQSIDLQARWMTAARDKIEAGKVVDEVEKIDRANPANMKLTMLTIGLVDNANPREKARLLSLISDVMTDPYAHQLKPQVAAELASDAKQAAMLDKPLVIAGKTIDGKDFTTTDWKGKVVLVDFWATWCAPCTAALPHVIETYNKYHDKGLEVVGVSSDFDIQALHDFISKNNVPWPQLFNPDAAGNHQPNPIALANEVQQLPAMFLLDKKGNLRSATAEDEMDDLIPKLLGEK